MSVVLRLDVPALERLLGGDTEIEVQLRQGVVEEFARRHLGTIIKDKSFQMFLTKQADVAQTGLQALVDARIGEIKKEPGTWSSRISVYLTDEVKAALLVEAEKRVDEAVRKAVDEVWTRREKRIVGEIYAAIASKTDALTESLVKDLVRDRLAKIATAVNEAKA